MTIIKKMGKVILGLAFSTALIITPNETEAAYYYSDAFYPGNGLPDTVIGTNPYWEDSSISTYGYGWHSEQARMDWDAASAADIDFYRVSSYSEASVRIYAGQYGLDYAGRIQPYKTDGTNASPYDPWYKVHIIINHGYMEVYDYTGNERLKTVIHEYGHMLSLNHQYDSSIMVQGKFPLTDPTSVDYTNVNWKY